MKVQSVISEISAAHGLSNTGYVLYPDLLFSCEKYISDMVHILCVYSQIGNPTKHRHFRLKRGMKSGSLSLQIFSRPEWKYLIMILTWNSCPGWALSLSLVLFHSLSSNPAVFALQHFRTPLSDIFFLDPHDITRYFAIWYDYHTILAIFYDS